MRLIAKLAAPALAALLASPALGHDGGGSHSGPHGHGGAIHAPPAPGPWYWGGNRGGWYGSWQQPWIVDMAVPPAVAPEGPPPRTREEWLGECRRRIGDNGLGGAVIGGVVGGLAGHAVAGRGDKVLGTVAGAAVGAVAGAAIDKAEDAGRARDRCEAMLDAPPAYGYGYPGAVMVPVMLVPMPGQGVSPPRGECKETVTTTEYVTYENRRSRHIPPRARSKRMPDKRVPY